MKKTRHLIASAPIAIAAMAALHTTAAGAQEAPTIVLDIPEEAPAASTAPVVPSTAPVATTSPVPAPITVQLPEPEPVAEPPVVNEAEPVATTQTTRAATREAPAPAPVAATQQAEPTTAPFANSQSEAAGEQPLAAATAPESAPPAAELTPVQDPLSDGSGAALLFALLAVGGVGLAAFLLFRSRRRKRDEEVPVIEQPVVAEPLSRDSETVGATYNSEPAPAMRAEPITPVTSNKDVAVELPSEAPRNPVERDRLLKRMIDAKPDRANPFASHKARAKRARLILQSLGTRFTDRKPGIDLSQYTNVWPELRGWRPATA
ncbi:hypothetical protein K3177_12590 [Qipengyuania sp. GH25]|uniref:LPXTG cell wall anchor domain-containing protein n=1 Tax=Qipengyuania pacifica TaxID=2860199 RepID=A0ABS7JI47_9SPHN|nr:hypothetical protein [Qipengyuania aerophila]MBX7489353.1 hypothetical protein [Qipengyuania aerophila]